VNYGTALKQKLLASYCLVELGVVAITKGLALRNGRHGRLKRGKI